MPRRASTSSLYTAAKIVLCTILFLKQIDLESLTSQKRTFSNPFSILSIYLSHSSTKNIRQVWSSGIHILFLHKYLQPPPPLRILQSPWCSPNTASRLFLVITTAPRTRILARMRHGSWRICTDGTSCKSRNSIPCTTRRGTNDTEVRFQLVCYIFFNRFKHFFHYHIVWKLCKNLKDYFSK